MHIVWDRTNKLLWLSQEKYVTKVLQRFNMERARPLDSTLPRNSKLSGRQCQKTKAEKAKMMKVPCASTIRSLMYAMVSSKPDIAYVIGVVDRFIRNPGNEHWVVIKWIHRYLKGTSSVCL